MPSTQLSQEPNVDIDPFLQLLNEATEVNIQELVPESGKGTPPRERRAFVVYLKPKPIRPTHPDLASGELSRDYIVENAEILLASEEFVLARNMFSFLLKDNLREPKALRGLGICLFRLGQIAAARKCFKALWEILGKEEALVWLGQCAISEKNDSLALELFGKVTSPHFLQRGERFDYYRELGNCLARANRFDEASQAYHHASEIEPTSDQPYVNLGMMEVQRLRPDVAATFFRKALSLNPKNPKGHCGLGLVAMAENNLVLARESFGMALDIDVTNLVAIYQLITLARDAATSAALKLRLEQFLAKEPRNQDIRFALAALLFKEGTWRVCEGELDRILHADPNHSRAKQLREELKSQKHP